MSTAISWRDTRRLTAERVAGIAYVAGLALGVAILVVFGFLAIREIGIGHNDFSYMWAGARTFLDGADPYAGASFMATARAYGTILPAESVFCYPPWVTLALVPLAALPVSFASDVWTFGGMALAAIALGALLRSLAPGLPVVHFLAGLSLFASQPGTANVWTGQWGFVLVAALCTSIVAVRDRRSPLTFAVIGLIAKPHLFVLALPALARAANARWGTRTLLWFIAPSTIAVAAGWAVFPDWLPAWRDSLIAQRFANQPPTTLENGFADLLGPSGHLLAAAVAVGLAAAALRFRPKGDAFIAVWLAVSFATPVYAWTYDHLVLIVPLVVAAGVQASEAVRRANVFASIGFAFFLVAPILLYVVADARRNESFSAAVPLAVALLCVGALWSRARTVST
jgi:hypothetical protein